MEALILSCGTGGGHNAAAQAVAEELTRRGHSVTVLDPYSLAGDRVARNVGGAYVRLVQAAPPVFGAVYQLGNAYRHLPFRSPVYWANGLMRHHMAAYLGAHPTDVIAATHMFPMQILAHVPDHPKAMYIATDYTCIPFSEESPCDAYVIPAPDLEAEFLRRGVPARTLAPYGIPVRAAFRRTQTRREARQRLGLEEARTYLLLAGGSIGAGCIRQAVQALESYLDAHPDCTLLVLCGSNALLLNQLRRRYGSHSQIQVLPATDRMADYVRASDLFITKPGGLSCTEGAVSGAPLLLLAPIPGCESRNAAYFASHGMALLVRRVRSQLLPAVEALRSGEAAAQMQARQAQCIDPDAVLHICDHLEALAAAH